MDSLTLLITVITIVVVMIAILLTCAYLIYFERKISAYVQDRIGPNRVGPYGLFQPIADGLKFLLKEEIIPDHVDKILFLIAPTIAVTRAATSWATLGCLDFSSSTSSAMATPAPRQG